MSLDTNVTKMCHTHLRDFSRNLLTATKECKVKKLAPMF